MIRKALLTAVGSLVLYSILIHVFQNDITRTGQIAAARNTVKAEEYLYEAASRYDTVIVGSSMSERIVTDSLGRGCYNLAMAGLSSKTGLALIRKSGHWPRLLYVETNTLLDPAKLDQLPPLNDPFVWQFLRQHLLFLRQKYQPLGVIKAVLRDWRHGKQAFIPAETGMYVDSARLEKAVAGWRAVWQQPRPDSVTQDDLRDAWQVLAVFRQHGTRLVFFEMPIDARLREAPLPRTVHLAIGRMCRFNQCLLIKPPLADRYQTTDGIHLTNPESTRYTAWLARQLRDQNQ